MNTKKEHSAILSTFIKLPFSIKTFVLSIFKWPLKTGFSEMCQLICVFVLLMFYVRDDWHTCLNSSEKSLKAMYKNNIQ